MTKATATPFSKPTEAWFENTWWWRIKERLQWTGWYQYVPNGVAATLMLLLAGIGALIGVWSWLLVGLPLALAAMLLAKLAYDIATVRYGLHPAEAVPPALDHLDAFDLMRARVACRSFEKRALSDAHRTKVLDLAEQQTRAENRIGTKPVRFEYLAAPLKVSPVIGATEFLVAIAEREYDEQAVVDVGRNLQKVVLEATRLGIATCWIGPGANPDSVAHHLGARFDANRDHVICVCAIGYPSRYRPLVLKLIQSKQRWRKPLDDLFFADTSFRKPIDPSVPPYSEFGRCFEVCQWSPSSYNGQTTRAAVIAENDKVVRVDFCSATKSRYYAMVALGIWMANWEIGCDALGIHGNFERVMIEDEKRPDLPRYVLSWTRAA